MSSSLGIQKIGLRWSAMLLSALWAGVHLDLTSAVLPNPTATLIYRIFFGFTASLAIVAAVAFILTRGRSVINISVELQA